MEDKRNCGGGSTNEGNFPIGLRVLAVDDDPICLKVLENLLRKCQYQVNTTNQAIIALKMLRENKNKYDLVISDVNMPDMDGFKLLEHVGLEMDLPVIMLSAHGDKELVYKGVTHGAVDYLLKPVRLEELRNIWQHVIRKKKLQLKDQNTSPNEDGAEDRTAENQQGAASSGNVEDCGKVNRKRKDKEEEEEEEEVAEEENEENGNENEESGTQKKPRVVWSMELHRSFVAAVNQLGLKKAVPKKILDLMNVEGLTRENVASHLQKYRLFLKRLSTEASQQSNMVAAFGANDSSYLRMNSLNGYGDFQTLTGPGRLSSTSLTSYSGGRMLGRLNSPVGLTLRGISSSSLLQQSHSSTLSNNVTGVGKVLPSGHGTNLYHGPSSLELNQIDNKSASQYGDLSGNNYSTGFTRAATFPDSRVNVGSLGTSVTILSNTSMQPLNGQQNQNLEAFSNQSLAIMPSLHKDSLNAVINGSSGFLDHCRSDENWKNSAQLQKFPTNSLPVIENFASDSLSSVNGIHNMNSTNSHTSNIPIDFSGNSGSNMNLQSSQSFANNSQNYSPHVNSPFNTINSLVHGNSTVNTFTQSAEQGKMFDGTTIVRSNTGPIFTLQQAETEKSSLHQNMRSNENYTLEQSKTESSYIHNDYNPLDDIVNSMMKRDQNETILEGQFGFDAYSGSADL